MNDAPDPKTFDLIAALQGRSYPKETVTIFLDEALMYEYAKARKASLGDPANKEKEKAADDMAEAFKSLALKIKVQGVPPHVRKSIRDTANTEHPVKFNNFGQPVPNVEFSNMLEDLTWENMVVEITAPDGYSFHPTPEDIKAFRAEAPDSAINAVAEAINGLSEDAQSGYEQIVQDPGFLSQP